MKMESCFAVAAAIFTSTFSIQTHASAQYWMGGCSSNWTSQCWSSTQDGPSNGVSEPQAGEDAYLYDSNISGGWEFIYHENSDSGVVLNSLHIDSPGYGYYGPVLVQTGASVITVVNEFVGEFGTGGLWQQGGSHAVLGTLVFGKNAGSHGIDELDAGVLTASNEIIGDAGRGEFYQGYVTSYGYGPSAHTVSGDLTLGNQVGGSGSYYLQIGTLSAQNEIVGNAGSGSIYQNGGVNNVSGTLTLGQAASGYGSYNLVAGVVTAFNEIIGDAGQGVFTQGVTYGYGATNTVSGTLTLGKQAGGAGTYNLNSGTLTAAQQIIGDAGTGVFNQVGGVNTISGNLVLGQQSGGQGTYNLIDGVLTAFNEIVGDAGNGTFTQGQNNFGYGATNPTNSVPGTLTVGKQASSVGTYNLLSGNLSASQQIIGYAGNGTFNQSGGVNTVNGDLTVGQQTGSHGAYNLLGGVLTAFNEVIGNAGEGTFTQGQNNYGYGATGPTNTVAGTLTLGKQANGVGTYNLLSGSLTAQKQVIGDAGTGTFTQGNNYGYGETSPTNTVTGTLTVGKQVGSSGTYNLISGTLSAQQQIIGDAGTGTFNQFGGSNSVASSLVLGQQAGGLGVYNLVDGVLAALNEVVGDAGTGTFTQGNNYGYGETSPTNTVTGTLTVGKQVYSSGTYNLISGTLSAQQQIIGDAGAGVFNQSGGHNTVNDTLTLAKRAGSSGTYHLQGGELHSSTVVVGDAGVGLFTQAGGVHFTTNLILGQQATGSGSYELLGGNLNVHGNIEHGAGASSVVINGGALNFDAGNHEVNVGSFLINGSGSVNLADNAVTVFQSNVSHHGQEIHVGSGANAIFNGEFEGAGPITGAGTVTFNNLFETGAFPLTFTVEGDMVLGHSSMSQLKIAGPLLGGFYDSIDVGGALTLGGELDLLSAYGYVAHVGDTYDLFEADNIFGQFDLLSLFALGDGMSWKVDYLVDAIGTKDVVRVSVISSVPLPASFWLLQIPLLGLAGLARRRSRLH